MNREKRAREAMKSRRWEKSTSHVSKREKENKRKKRRLEIKSFERKKKVVREKEICRYSKSTGTVGNEEPRRPFPRTFRKSWG